MVYPCIMPSLISDSIRTDSVFEGFRALYMNCYALAKDENNFIVEAEALPEIYLKVAETKRLLEIGEVTTVNAATQRTGISRSAFYKYKDAVRPFNDMLHGRIVTFHILLRDVPGALSGVLNVFSGCGSNILTINQGIPANGCAVVTISAETMDLTVHIEELLRLIRKVPGVIKAEVLAG